MKVFRWIVGVFFSLGIFGITEQFLVSVTMLLLGLFIIPPTHELLLTKNGIKLSSGLKWIISIGLFMLSGYFVVLSEDADWEAGDQLVLEAEDCLARGQVDSMYVLLDRAKEIYPGTANKANKLLEHLDSAQSKNLIYLTIAQMNDEDYELLRANKLQKQYIPQITANAMFLNNLHSNVDKREEFREFYLKKQEEKAQRDALAAQKRAEAEERARVEKAIESSFSAWDGSHIQLTRLIKESMNDPDSYDHIETKYWNMTDHLVVLTKFRGKNGFGALVINHVKAKVAIEGQVLEIIDQF